MTDAYSPNSNSPSAGPRQLTIDEIFLRSVARRPQSLALVDPLDRMRVTGHAPRRLTYRQTNRAVSALAGRFIDAGLKPGAVIAAQLPNTVEAMITVLAALRAGLVMAPLPLLWRLSELSEALNRIKAQALVTMARIDGVQHAELARRAATNTLSVKYVAAFGDELPENVASLDDTVEVPTSDPVEDSDLQTKHKFPEQDSRSAALITFDVTREGLRIVPRTQVQLSAGGLAIMLETHLAHGAPMLCAVMPSTFAGLCASLLTWLLNGSTLVLHHPFDAETLIQQLAEDNCATLIAPAELLARLDESGELPKLPALRDAIALWRQPERAASAHAWGTQQTLTDLYAFGEAGLVLARRGLDGRPAALYPENPRKPRTLPVGEMMLTRHGTLGLRGPMVPVAAYAASLGEEALPDHVDTGFAAELDRRTGAIVVTDTPADVATVGGYRFTARDLMRWSDRMSDGAMLTSVPDDISGSRLHGNTPDSARTRAVLSEIGVNPLLVEAFRERGG